MISECIDLILCNSQWSVGCIIHSIATSNRSVSTFDETELNRINIFNDFGHGGINWSHVFWLFEESMI